MDAWRSPPPAEALIRRQEDSLRARRRAGFNRTSPRRRPSTAFHFSCRNLRSSPGQQSRQAFSRDAGAVANRGLPTLPKAATQPTRDARMALGRLVRAESPAGQPEGGPSGARPLARPPTAPAERVPTAMPGSRRKVPSHPRPHSREALARARNTPMISINHRIPSWVTEISAPAITTNNIRCHWARDANRAPSLRDGRSRGGRWGIPREQRRQTARGLALVI
jgi:hypothetical protein